MKKKMLEYVKSVLSKDDYDRCMEAWERKEPIPYDVADEIADLCEEFCDDNDLPEGWWMNFYSDAEEVFKEL